MVVQHVLHGSAWLRQYGLGLRRVPAGTARHDELLHLPGLFPLARFSVWAVRPGRYPGEPQTDAEFGPPLGRAALVSRSAESKRRLRSEQARISASRREWVPSHPLEEQLEELRPA